MSCSSKSQNGPKTIRFGAIWTTFRPQAQNEPKTIRFGFILDHFPAPGPEWVQNGRFGCIWITFRPQAQNVPKTVRFGSIWTTFLSQKAQTGPKTVRFRFVWIAFRPQAQNGFKTIRFGPIWTTFRPQAQNCSKRSDLDPFGLLSGPRPKMGPNAPAQKWSDMVGGRR